MKKTLRDEFVRLIRSHHVEPQDCPVGVSEDAMELAATKLLEDVIDPEGYACWLPKQIPTQPKAHAWNVGSHDQATVDALRKEYATTYGPNVVPLVRIRRAA